MKRKKRNHTIGKFVIKLQNSYYADNKLWTASSINLTTDIEKAKVFTYKEHAEDLANHLLKCFTHEIIELK